MVYLSYLLPLQSPYISVPNCPFFQHVQSTLFIYSHSRNLCSANKCFVIIVEKRVTLLESTNKEDGRKIHILLLPHWFEPFLAAISECLKPFTSPPIINGHKVTALLHTGSSLSFIKFDMAKRLNLKTKPSSGHVQMASSISSPISKEAVSIKYSVCLISKVPIIRFQYRTVTGHILLFKLMVNYTNSLKFHLVLQMV